MAVAVAVAAPHINKLKLVKFGGITAIDSLFICFLCRVSVACLPDCLGTRTCVPEFDSEGFSFSFGAPVKSGEAVKVAATASSLITSRLSPSL